MQSQLKTPVIALLAGAVQPGTTGVSVGLWRARHYHTQCIAGVLLPVL
jgi:hypothetical protein